MDPDTMKLPDHLKAEAIALRNAARTDNPVTDAQARPLLRSTVIWLARNGTVNKEDSPGVIQKAGDLLHNLIPLHLLQVPKGKIYATDFASRIFTYLQNNVTRATSSHLISVGHDEALSTPMRSMEKAGVVVRMKEGEVPPQGHSGRSILGKSASRTDPDAPAPNDSSLPDSDAPSSMNSEREEPSVPVPTAAAAVSSASASVLANATAGNMSSAAILNAFARSAGLDISITPAGRAHGASALPTTQLDSIADNGGAGKGGGSGGGGGRANGRANGRASGRAPVPPAHTPAHAGTDAQEPAGEQSGGRAGGRAGGKSAHTDAQEASPTRPAQRRRQSESFVPSLPFERSKHAGKPLSDEPLTVGTKVTFYMQLPEDKGGIEWYLGSVARMSRSNWVDVEFPDGKLWCSMKASERGTRWVALA